MADRGLERGLERLTDLPIALAVRAVGAALGRIGPRGGYLIARLAGDVWWRCFPGRRGIALRNLEIAFPDAPADERARIGRASCRHAMATLVDAFLRDRALTPESWPRFISAGREVEALIERPRPRGLAILSAHLGDWEMAQYYLALRGLPGAAVARLVHNPHLERLAREMRSRRGASVIPKAGGLRRMWKALEAGRMVGLMPDQSAHPGERYFPFFGVRGATYFQYARLLARLRPQVAFVVCLREGLQFRFRVEARDLSGALLGPGSEEERAERLVTRYLALLEEAARAHPEQYLWVHRRWKYRPPGAADLYQGLRAPLDRRLLEAGERSPREAPAPEPAAQLLESPETG